MILLYLMKLSEVRKADDRSICTIHKKTLCLTQKYPETWGGLHNPIHFSKFEYRISFFSSSDLKMEAIFHFESFLLYISQLTTKSLDFLVQCLWFHLIRGWVILDEICDNLVINKKSISKILKKMRKLE